MKLQKLFESGPTPTIVKARRSLKFSSRSGDNSLGIDFKTATCEFFILRQGSHWRPIVFIGRPSSLKAGKSYHFVNDEKPTLSATGNFKFSETDTPYEIDFETENYDEFMKHFGKCSRDTVVIVDPKLLRGVVAPEKKNDDPTSPEDGYFLLGYWSNAWSSRDHKEYFWSGAFYTRAEALAFGKMKQQRGQPKEFRDWAAGTNKVIRGVDAFVAAAKKVGLNPNVSDIYFHE